MILRDPVERAFSQYLHNARDGVVRSSFGEQIELALNNTGHEFQPLYPFLENGLYYEQVKRYLDLFSRESIRIFVYEDAWQAPAALLTDIFKFLGVDPTFQPDLSFRELERRTPRSLTAHYLLRKSGAGARLRALLPHGSLPRSLRAGARAMLFKPRGSATMDPRDRQTLREYYREDVSKLAELLGHDFRHWLRP
jgi:Sulfotransferase domain